MQSLEEITGEGITLYEEGRLGEAVDRYDEALEMDPGCLFACVSKAIIFMETDRDDEALELLEKFSIRDDDPLASWAFFHKATAYYHAGRPGEALSCLDRVEASDPDYASSRFNKAVILEEYHQMHGGDSRIGECLSCYDEAVAARPDFADAMYNKGLILQKMCRPEEALEIFEGAIRVSPDFAEAHDSKGSVLNFMGRYAEAVPCHEEALRLRPDFATALHNMANTLYRLGCVGEARDALKAAVLLDPELPNHADIMSMLDDRLDFNWKILGGTHLNSGTMIRPNKGYSWELDRTRHVLLQMAPIFPYVMDRKGAWSVETYGLAGRGAKCRFLRLDTDKDELVAKMWLLGGCVMCNLECCYYRHLDESGAEYFYKIGPSVTGQQVPPHMLEKISRCLQDVESHPSCTHTTEDAVKRALLALRSKTIAARVFGAYVMTRNGVLRDFDRLKDGYGLEIRDSGLEKDYYPRPTYRGFGGYVLNKVVFLNKMEKELYWNRLKKREPIPPEVWKFLEDARSGRFENNPLWLEHARERLHG